MRVSESSVVGVKAGSTLVQPAIILDAGTFRTSQLHACSLTLYHGWTAGAGKMEEDGKIGFVMNALR